MKKKDISRLLQRYLTGHQEGKDAYFDADEIDELLDSFEESDDYTYYDEVLALGLRLHPGNPDLQIRQCKSYVYNEDYDSALALIESIAETDNQDLDMLRLECYVMQDSTCRKTHRQQMRVFRNAIRIYRTNLRGCGND